ncbi:MAG: glutamine-hydrolyzing carbamoyl-phosphate synthase small subunit [Pseudomonadota bacterium]
MQNSATQKMTLELADGTRFEGFSFGAEIPASGEVVFNTGMVGYPESLTDPSYRGQILVLTYPLIGNYGVAKMYADFENSTFESERIQIAGLVVSSVSHDFSHFSAIKSLSQWLKDHNIPAIEGVDTRALTKRLREYGTISGRFVTETTSVDFLDYGSKNYVAETSCKEVKDHGEGKKRVVLIDCGCKNNILRNLKRRGLAVTQVPWDYDFNALGYDGLFISNGPGDPKSCTTTIKNIRQAFERNKPIFGICLGNQLMALAAGADTYKLKYGHRSQNQPCVEVNTKRCFITSQNHGYAVEGKSLPGDWKEWFVNANDATNEGIRHATKPFFSVQFHPESYPGPSDTNYLFDHFVKLL